MTSVADASLYEKDFVRWSEQQASALRAAARSGTNLPLDWENLAEEVEDLGSSVRRELRKHIRNIIEHLIKLQFSPADGPRRGWQDTVRRERADIEDLLRENPSLRRLVAEFVTDAAPQGTNFAVASLDEQGESTAATLARLSMGAQYTPEQVLSAWLPEAEGLIDP